MDLYEFSYFAIKFYWAILITIILIFAKKYIDKMLENRHIKLENDKFKMYMDITPKTVEEEIDNFIKDKLDQYALENFIVKGVEFIKADEVDKMVKELDKTVLLSMSDLYLFYCKLLTNISSEEDLINFINNKVRNRVLGFVTEFNKPV